MINGDFYSRMQLNVLYLTDIPSPVFCIILKNMKVLNINILSWFYKQLCQVLFCLGVLFNALGINIQKLRKGGIYWCITRVMAVTACHMLCKEKSLAKWKFRSANNSEWYLRDHWNYWKWASYFIMEMSHLIPHSFIYSHVPKLTWICNQWRSII